MNRALLPVMLAFVCAGHAFAEPAGKAKHIVVVVWDGLRPDSVSEKTTPTLFKLARDGVFFQNHHAVFVSSTEVNGVAMATGAYPNRSGILANREYRPGINPLRSIGIASADSIRKGDEVTAGHYLKLPTLPEILRAAGRKTAIAGAKPIAVLLDRSNRANIKQPESTKVETPNTPADATMT
ncbi:MAG: alkaline phosphatase family protein, partial [Gammaproteobacteria bacterium]